MEKLTKEVDAILLERFGKDSIIALATAVDNIPYVRSVDAFYENGVFYVLTHGLSSKMKQIEHNSTVALYHASCAALYVALKELGFTPTLCAGEVDAHSFIFDHSWIELDGKIIDVAIAFPLQGKPLSNLIILGVDIFTKESSNLVYGTSCGTGLDIDADFATTVPFCSYMDNFPDAPNGLWSVVELLLGRKVDIAAMRTKYKDTKWTVC